MAKPPQGQGVIRTKAQPQISNALKSRGEIKFSAPTPQNGDYDENSEWPASHLR